MEWIKGGFRISTDPAELSVDAIQGFLAQSYWANTRPRTVIEASIAHSLVFGLYHDKQQIGFARAITDYSTFYYLVDVFVAEDYRGQGLGKWLVATIVSCPELQSLHGLLTTRDAHGLYEQFGFQTPVDPQYFMHRKAGVTVPQPEKLERSK
jgi:GNAT superfamily N-acetyltransferase